MISYAVRIFFEKQISAGVPYHFWLVLAHFGSFWLIVAENSLVIDPLYRLVTLRILNIFTPGWWRWIPRKQGNNFAVGTESKY